MPVTVHPLRDVTLETEAQEERSKSRAVHHMNVLGSDALEGGCHKWKK